MRTYASPEAFKQALETRLRQASSDGLDFARRRQLLVFDRFLARILAAFAGAVVLKGGLVLEIRLERARTTKDIDLRFTGPADSVLPKLQEAAQLDLGDFLSFEVGPDPDHPDIQNDGMKYDGQRFRAECQLAGKIYGKAFGVDVTMGDPLVGKLEVFVANDLLGFAGMAPPSIPVYPIETHIAEKRHAYTMPRERPNSRVKDLPDIALLAGAGALAADLLAAALRGTFEYRRTHALPSSLPEPALAWEVPYAAMAREDNLPWPTLAEVTLAAQAFLDPVLAGGSAGVWDATAWAWVSEGNA